MPKPNYHPKLLIPQIALLQRVRAVGATREPVRRVLVHVSALRVHFDGFQSIHDLDKGISGDDELIRVLVSDEIPPVVHQVERRRAAREVSWYNTAQGGTGGPAGSLLLVCQELYQRAVLLRTCRT